jgi:hypothetical protein
LCANIYGDVWIGSSYGEIRWIYRNPSNLANTNVGEPKIIYTKKGLFVFLLDDKILYYTNDFYDKTSIIKNKPTNIFVTISKYHVQRISSHVQTSTYTDKNISLNLSNKGQIKIGQI